MGRGVFIAFEGGDGSGKSTQSKLLYEFLTAKGKDVVLTREPGGSCLAEKVRDIVLHTEFESDAGIEAYLFAAARREHTQTIIVPALNEGKCVICDRYYLSSLAYQGYAGGLGFETVADINRLAIKDAVPDITVFFDVPPRDIFREKGTMSDRFENLNSDYHDKVYQGYKEGLSFFQQQFPDSLEIVLSPKKGDIQGSFRDIVSRIKNYI